MNENNKRGFYCQKAFLETRQVHVYIHKQFLCRSLGLAYRFGSNPVPEIFI